MNCQTCKEISKIVDARLFILRQKPRVTREQEVLSQIELILHEAAELKLSQSQSTSGSTLEYTWIASH